MEFATLEYDDRRFRVADAGDGRPVVLLHGFPDGPESWSDTADAVVSAGHRAIVPFLRGYHRDTIDAGRGYSAPEISGDVVTLLDALDLDTAVVVGHDWGASCTWGVAARAPQRLDGVVVIGIPHPASIRPSPKLAWAVRHFWSIKAPRSDQRVARNDLAYIDTLYRRWSPHWSGPARNATVARAKDILRDPVVRHEALQYYRDLSLRPDPVNTFRVDRPGLLVAGGGTELVGGLDPYRASLDRFDAPAELLVVDGAGHWPHREGADRFHEVLIEFLGSLL
ncbi:MAG: alpha/beta hydrolase [Acidimicrobiia bacterium]|nr:alpha/beta hydrolase [Acidimicrobiia bacterium]